jgi:hypothetical protein
MGCQCDPNCKRGATGAFCPRHKRCTRKSPLSGWEPEYNPRLFNQRNAKDLRESHNCYAYAVGHIDLSATKNAPFVQPGYAAGYGPFMNKPPVASRHTCSDIISRFFGDMPEIRRRVTYTDMCPAGTSKVALVVDPSADYHWYRQDSNGWWSHKPGSTNVTNRDAAGSKIWDPALAARDYKTLDYTAFCGYFCVPRSKEPHVARIPRGGSKARTKRRAKRGAKRGAKGQTKCQTKSRN